MGRINIGGKKITFSGNATTSDVLFPKTFYSDSETKQTGGIQSKGAQTYTPSTVNQTIVANQYLAGIQLILGDANLISANIPVGKSIFNVSGTYTSDATATANDILSGKSGYINGVKVIGVIPSKTSQTYTPSTVNQTISAGQYLSGTQTILGDADLVPSKILSGETIFNVTGTAQFTTATFTYPTVNTLTNYLVSGHINEYSTPTLVGSKTITKLNGTVGIEYTIEKQVGWEGAPFATGTFSLYKNGILIPNSTSDLTVKLEYDSPPVILVPNCSFNVQPSDIISFYANLNTTQFGVIYGHFSLVMSNDIV